MNDWNDSYRRDQLDREQQEKMNKNKKRESYAQRLHELNYLSEQDVSNPKIFPPPIEVGQQIQLSSSLNKETEHEQFDNDHDLMQLDKQIREKSKIETIAQKKSTKKKQLIKPHSVDELVIKFSDMLEKNPTSNIDEHAPILDEFSDLLEIEPISMVEETSFIHDKPVDNTQETSFHEEKLKSTTSESGTLTDDFYALLEDKYTTNNEKTSSFEGDSLAEDDEESLLTNELYNLLEEPIPAQDEFDKDYKDKKSITTKKGSTKKLLPIVKLPVFLSTFNVDIKILDSIDLLTRIDHVSKIEWSMESLEVRVLTPSDTVFLIGTLLVTIEYVNEGKVKSIHTMKTSIPWTETAKVNWVNYPSLASSSQNEFLFQNESNLSSHFEYKQKFAEKIESNLRRMNVVWHEQLNSESTNSKLLIEGIANISMDLLQLQYVDLQLGER